MVKRIKGAKELRSMLLKIRLTLMITRIVSLIQARVKVSIDRNECLGIESMKFIQSKLKRLP